MSVWGELHLKETLSSAKLHQATPNYDLMVKIVIHLFRVCRLNDDHLVNLVIQQSFNKVQASGKVIFVIQMVIINIRIKIVRI